MQNKINLLKESYGDLSEPELQKLSDLFKRVFKKNFTPQFIEWFYKKNPDGKALTYNAAFKDKIIGHYALVPINLCIHGQKQKSAISVFTAVDREFRGMHLFSKLAKKTYQLAKDEGFKYIIGVSNDISTKLFIRYFKFKFISKLDAKFGFGEIKKKNFEKKFNVIRSEESFKWRLANPRFNYKIVKKNDKLHVYNNYYKLFNLKMSEFKIDEYKSFGNVQLNKLNFNPFNLWIGLGDYDWKNSLYFNFPEFLKPAPLNFIIKNITNEDEQIELEKKDIDFQLIDFDIF